MQLFYFVVINVGLSDSYDYEFFMTVHVMLCLNERDIHKKEKIKKWKKERKKREEEFPLTSLSLNANPSMKGQARVNLWKLSLSTHPL